MAHDVQPYAPPIPSAAPPRGPRALALALLLDLLILAVAVVAVSFALLAAVASVRVLQLGITAAEATRLGPAELLRLVGPGGVLLVLLAQNALFVAVPAIRVRLLHGEPLATIGLQARDPLRLALFGLGLGLLLLVGNAILGALFAAAGIRQNQAEQYPLFAGDYVGQALFMLGAAVVVPIGEEVLFRGYIFSTLLRIGAGTPWGVPAAYALSALLFGLAHALAATQGAVALIAATLVMGLVLAWAVRHTGSVLPSIVAHSVNNGVALLALMTCINTPGLCPDS
ncbi:MAG TPA: CPBP family intramembrane glutamic endopeptidase [Roseiflexaceae bacterium]|nr:CPBP family intramembrane glutamic endopeptidase [Roseiflexaceae bacterium]